MKIEASLTDPLEAQLADRVADRLRIGVVIPQSGALGMIGPSALDAALLAAHEVNVSGGVRGSYVDLVLVDGGRAPGDVAAEVGRLSQAAAIDAVVGIHTSDVHRAVELAVGGRTPYVFTPPHEGGPRLPGVVCIGADPVHQLRGAISWLTAHHGLLRWALIGNDYIWPRSVHHAAHTLIARAGSGVVMDQRVPLGGLTQVLDRLLDDLRASRADAVLLSLVGRDLAAFNKALRQSGIDRGMVRLSGALEENGLLAFDGDRTGLLYAAMSSFVSLTDDKHLDLAERYAALLGPQAPVLDSYAEGVYDGLHLVAALADQHCLRPGPLTSSAERLVDRTRAHRVHLARAEGFEFCVVPGVS